MLVYSVLISSDIPIAEMVQAKIKSVFKQFDNAGATPAFWTIYDRNNPNLYSCRAHGKLLPPSVANRMLDIFAAGGRHN